MSEIVFLLEEVSAREFLKQLLPRVLPADRAIPYRFIVFEGKQDLDRQIERRIRGYVNPQARFIVLRDQDNADCLELKKALSRKCEASGKNDVIVRIACRELESFYLGDLAAVEAAFGIRGLTQRQNERKFREPDRLGSPSQELERLTKRRYQKVSGSRAIAAHLRIEDSRSRSFGHLVDAIRRVSGNTAAARG
ncbi:MAG TPA: DUF4276 family protein [Bryobacteraceae bacterium]|nr:hypothetical protein [Bryobacterales bacterium]HRJ19921.1 DUF4276 family protein [Bryobacteraceae bacterium]